MNGLPIPADLLARGLWALAIIAGGLLLYRLTNQVVLARAQKNLRSADEEFALRSPGVAAILYFTTPDCVPCKTVQRPALKKLEEQLGNQLQVIEVNAAERPDLASQWGVLSVPTTFIIDRSGQLRHVNHGATRAEQLLRQLNDVLPGR